MLIKKFYIIKTGHTHPEDNKKIYWYEDIDQNEGEYGYKWYQERPSGYPIFTTFGEAEEACMRDWEGQLFEGFENYAKILEYTYNDLEGFKLSHEWLYSHEEAIRQKIDSVYTYGRISDKSYLKESDIHLQYKPLNMYCIGYSCIKKTSGESLNNSFIKKIDECYGMTYEEALNNREDIKTRLIQKLKLEMEDDFILSDFDIIKADAPEFEKLLHNDLIASIEQGFNEITYLLRNMFIPFALIAKKQFVFSFEESERLKKDLNIYDASYAHFVELVSLLSNEKKHKLLENQTFVSGLAQKVNDISQQFNNIKLESNENESAKKICAAYYDYMEIVHKLSFTPAQS